MWQENIRREQLTPSIARRDKIAVGFPVILCKLTICESGMTQRYFWLAINVLSLSLLLSFPIRDSVYDLFRIFRILQISFSKWAYGSHTQIYSELITFFHWCAAYRFHATSFYFYRNYFLSFSSFLLLRIHINRRLFSVKIRATRLNYDDCLTLKLNYCRLSFCRDIIISNETLLRRLILKPWRTLFYSDEDFIFDQILQIGRTRRTRWK